MDPVSIFAIVGATAAVVSSFRDGLDMFKDWRKKRKEKRLAKVSQVEKSLERNPPEVQREYKRHVSELGRRFEEGDDISNKSLAKIIEKFTRTLTATLKELNDFNFKSLFEVSENARHDSLDVMLQLCQRLHTCAPIRNMKKAKSRTPAEEPESKCAIHSCNSSSSAHPVQIQVYNCNGDDLQYVLDRMPKADPIVTVSGPSILVSHAAGNSSLWITQTAQTQGPCQCGHSVAVPDPASIHHDHEKLDNSSPLKKRLDEMDQNFGSIRNNVVGQPPSSRPTTYPPPSNQLFVPKHSPKASADTGSQKWHLWSPAPSIMSSAPSAATRLPPRSLASDLVYSQPKVTSLQEKLNTMTQAMISTKLGSTFVPSPSSALSVYSAFSPVPLPITSQLPPMSLPNLNNHRGRVSQWVESIETESLAPGPISVSGDSTTASLVYPGVRRYTGSVEMTGCLPTPPP